MLEIVLLRARTRERCMLVFAPVLSLRTIYDSVSVSDSHASPRAVEATAVVVSLDARWPHPRRNYFAKEHGHTHHTLRPVSAEHPRTQSSDAQVTSVGQQSN